MLQKNYSEVSENASTLKIILESVAQTFRIFFTRITFIVGQDNWLLTISRVLGAIVSFAAIFSILWSVFRDQIDRPL